MGNKNIAEAGKNTRFKTGLQQVAVASRGGKKSQQIQHENKSFQQLATRILSMALQSGEVHTTDEIQSLAEVNGKNLTVAEAILIKQVEKALKGDLNSATFVRDTSGQKPVEQVQNINPPQIVIERPKE